MHFWLKSYLWFCRVIWMKLMEVARIFYQYRDHFFRMMDFTAWLWGWNVRVKGILLLFSFWDVCSADCRSIFWARWWPAWTTEAGESSLQNLFFKSALLILTVSTNAFHSNSTNLFCCFSRYQAPTNSVAPYVWVIDQVWGQDYPI